MKLIYLKLALKCDSFDVAIGMKIQFFRVLVSIEPGRSLLQFVTANCLIKPRTVNSTQIGNVRSQGCIRSPKLTSTILLWLTYHVRKPAKIVFQGSSEKKINRKYLILIQN